MTVLINIQDKVAGTWHVIDVNRETGKVKLDGVSMDLKFETWTRALDLASAFSDEFEGVLDKKGHITGEPQHRYYLYTENGHEVAKLEVDTLGEAEGICDNLNRYVPEDNQLHIVTEGEDDGN